MAIDLSLVVKEDFAWSLTVHGVDVDGKRCPSISKFSNPLLPVNVNQFIECLDKLAICPGHPDSHFVEFAKAKRKFTSAEPQVAKHIMLVFMVRGLFIPLNFPYAQFATRNLSADLIFPLVWEIVQKLEAAGFKVVAINSDGTSSNRKFYHMHLSPTAVTTEDSTVVYKTKNPYADEDRDIYFFSDVPHLIKTIRNCWSNSFAHSNSRALWVSIL